MDRLASCSLPAGNILVPCCGPGHEIAMMARNDSMRRLVEQQPKHCFIGIDISEGMVALANDCITQESIAPLAAARVGDASRLSSSPGLAPVAGILSVFGLQQMPQPGSVLADWVRCLEPGGVAAVCFWPARVEESGPWHTYSQVGRPDKIPAGRGRHADVATKVSACLCPV